MWSRIPDVEHSLRCRIRILGAERLVKRRAGPWRPSQHTPQAGASHPPGRGPKTPPATSGRKIGPRRRRSATAAKKAAKKASTCGRDLGGGTQNNGRRLGPPCSRGGRRPKAGAMVRHGREATVHVEANMEGTGPPTPSLVMMAEGQRPPTSHPPHRFKPSLSTSPPCCARARPTLLGHLCNTHGARQGDVAPQFRAGARCVVGADGDTSALRLGAGAAAHVWIRALRQEDGDVNISTLLRARQR